MKRTLNGGYSYIGLYAKVKKIGWKLHYLSDYSGILISPTGNAVQLEWRDIASFVSRAA